MNMYSGARLTYLMKPVFWKRANPFKWYANHQRAHVLLASSKCQALANELVQKSLHQLTEYEEHTNGQYMQPLVALEQLENNWDSMTKNLSNEEVSDLENARTEMKRYEQIYNIFEYGSTLNEFITSLETRIASNNVTIPMSSYRYSKSTSIEELFPEIEKCLEAYYELIDDCAEYPDWRYKVEQDLGGVVSYLALNIDESSRDAAVQQSKAFERFDLEKQRYFK
mmetsp:Transcript_37155/g.50384  ORF Transcript_37155/g.50384 Transcript_37155/m.50384 type:complete len:225 (+) Transcript_37155:16-690(+)|eukprot:CAMPEP_0176348066 /NCGR_PEP_ID=MMETSP0126-20121128/7573_1 /TAXON_ID=141414 ORGANISM="Strombidinopsis acuminatum, Strain SPMC142" /NCGR_SAMPLE_ID=MMETSP0126 /ASSEMBLY_ACC=CAM_ASM_000229 /LENGTH=224 /DNA_ID=CAMNT_0017696645 /DNA_START=16 /DNA_END=690 /DNA_ORIENTATION=+